jgi:cephalosporin hydroxylase
MIEVIEHGNSGINIFTYKGQKAVQVVGVEKAFDQLARFLTDLPITLIIELGSDCGGLTNLLADHKISSHATIHTFDINNTQFKSYNSKIIFHHSSFEDAHDEILSLIQSNNRVLLLCDGGNKPKEFYTYCPHLKLNDVIMSHDYIANEQEFISKYKNTVWNWQEFQDSNITCENIQPILQEEFKKYVWFIGIKND